jgi:hypothetical protein
MSAPKDGRPKIARLNGQRILKFFHQGFDYAGVAEITGYRPKSVYWWLYRHGLVANLDGQEQRRAKAKRLRDSSKVDDHLEELMARVRVFPRSTEDAAEILGVGNQQARKHLRSLLRQGKLEIINPGRKTALYALSESYLLTTPCRVDDLCQFNGGRR